MIGLRALVEGPVLTRKLHCIYALYLLCIFCAPLPTPTPNKAYYKFWEGKDNFIFAFVSPCHVVLHIVCV